MFQDESRFGLMSIKRKKITSLGIKPVGKVDFTRKYYYLYGAIEPITGESFMLEMPNLNTDWFQIYLDELSKEYIDTMNVLILDNGTFHKSKSLVIPDNIKLIFLPPYSPELNPIERLWMDIKKSMGYKIYESLEKLQKYLNKKLNQYSKEQIRSISFYPYIKKAVKGI